MIKPRALLPDPLALPDWSDPIMILGSNLVAAVFLLRLAFVLRSRWIRWRYNLVHVERARSGNVERAVYLSPDREELERTQQRGDDYAAAHAARLAPPPVTSTAEAAPPSPPAATVGERVSELASFGIALTFVVLCGAVAVEMAIGDPSPGLGDASQVVLKRFWPGLSLATLLLLAAATQRGTRAQAA